MPANLENSAVDIILEKVVFITISKKGNAKECASESESRSVMSDSATLWTVACQDPLSMEFSIQEYRSR